MHRVQLGSGIILCHCKMPHNGVESYKLKTSTISKQDYFKRYEIWEFEVDSFRSDFPFLKILSALRKLEANEIMWSNKRVKINRKR